MSFDGLAVLLLMIALPFQDQAAPILGYSVVKLIFAAVAVMTMVKRGQAMLAAAGHPLFVSLWMLIAVAALSESLHGGSLTEVQRVAEMAFGALVVAALCRTPEGVRFATSSYVVAGTVVAALLGFYQYGLIAGVGAGDFSEASQIRDAAFSDPSFVIAPNAAGFMAAQGAVLALVYALTVSQRSRQILWAALAIAGVFGALLTMSRGAAAVIVIGVILAVLHGGMGKLKIAATLLVLSAAVYALAPEATISRITDLSASHGPAAMDRDVRESRVKVLEASLEHLPEYFATGVGADYFWSDWALAAGFPVSPKVGVIGSHNTFIQITLYWGVGALLPLLLLAAQAVRIGWRARHGDATGACIAIVAASMLIWLMLQHSLFAKQFTVGFGVLVAFDRLYLVRQVGTAVPSSTARRLAAIRLASDAAVLR